MADQEGKIQSEVIAACYAIEVQSSYWLRRCLLPGENLAQRVRPIEPEPLLGASRRCFRVHARGLRASVVLTWSIRSLFLQESLCSFFCSSASMAEPPSPLPTLRSRCFPLAIIAHLSAQRPTPRHPLTHPPLDPWLPPHHRYHRCLLLRRLPVSQSSAMISSSQSSCVL